MTRGSARRCFPLALVAAVSMAGCSTTPGHGERVPATPTSHLPHTRPVPTPSTTPVSSAPASQLPTTAAQTTGAVPSTSVPPTSAPPPASTCTDVSVRVLPGGATFGEQIAGLQFTNTGTTTCILAGYPTVTLLLHGQVIGRQSVPSSRATSVRRLAPGEVAESLVHDYTQTCQAPLSDSVRVQVPGESTTVTRPDMQLRACVLRVDRLRPPD